MATYDLIGIAGTQEVDNAHAWLLTALAGTESFSISTGAYIKYCRALCMGADEVFYTAGDDGGATEWTCSVVRTGYGVDTANWETVLTGTDIGDNILSMVYDSVGEKIVVTRYLGTVNVLDKNGVELWTYLGAVPLWGSVSDADGYVYVCGERTAGQLGEANTASVWKLEWNVGTVQYDVIAYYDTGGNVYGISIDSSGNLLVCGDEITSKNVWKLTSAMALSASWLISNFDLVHSCEWLSTGNFVIAGDGTHTHLGYSDDTTVGQVQVINASTGAVIWEKIPSLGADYLAVRTIGVDAADGVHALYGIEIYE